MFVCLSVGMWRAIGPILMKFLHAHPHLYKEGFGPGLTPAPSPRGLGGLKS